jgi:AraC-like DNA-binding protein
MSVISEILSGQVSFSVPEILSLFGVAQCVYILVYLAFRSGRIARGTIPILFFLFLGTAFALDLAQSSWAPLIDSYRHIQWFFWFSVAPLSVLLVLQISIITRVPHWEYFLLILLMPLGYFLALSLVGSLSECASLYVCEEMSEGLIVVGIVISAFSLLTIWIKKDTLENLLKQKRGNERFWLVISIILLNVSLIAVFIAALYDFVKISDAYFVRTFVGFAFVYLAATSLFRIYPQAVSIRPKDKDVAVFLTDSEIEVAVKIEGLLNVEKIYQEPSYGRSDLAKEIDVSESILSKIVNSHFDKSVPQLLNAYRVGDAKRLLVDTEEDLAVISEEAGFNSVTTFNRHFKDLTGITPSEYRASKVTS